MNKLSKFNLKVLGFNSQNFQVPSEPLNRVATVFLTPCRVTLGRSVTICRVPAYPGIARTTLRPAHES